MAAETFDKVVAYRLHMNGPQTNVHDKQAGAIADADEAAGGAPSAEEFDALVVKFNALLAACRGVGIVAAA